MNYYTKLFARYKSNWQLCKLSEDDFLQIKRAAERLCSTVPKNTVNAQKASKETIDAQAVYNSYSYRIGNKIVQFLNRVRRIRIVQKMQKNRFLRNLFYKILGRI